MVVANRRAICVATLFVLLCVASRTYADNTFRSFQTPFGFQGGAGDAEHQCAWILRVSATLTVTIEFDESDTPVSAEADVRGTHTFESTPENQCGAHIPLPVGPFTGPASLSSNRIDFSANTLDGHFSFSGDLAADRSNFVCDADWSHSGFPTYAFSGMRLFLSPAPACEVPDGEESTFFDWNRSDGERTQALFTAKLISSAGADFVGRRVQESTPIEPPFSRDTCWELADRTRGPGRLPPPFISVLPGPPIVIGLQNDWTDEIGWNEVQVEFYMKVLNDAGVKSCGTVIKQEMVMYCDDETPTLYATNYITNTIIAPARPNQSGTVLVARCSEAEFESQRQQCPMERTVSRAWFAANGRNR
jgi:hypothetical protein